MKKKDKKNEFLKIGLTIGVITAITIFHLSYLYQIDNKSFKILSFYSILIGAIYFMILTFTTISIIKKINFERLINGKKVVDSYNKIITIGSSSLFSYYITDYFIMILDYLIMNPYNLQYEKANLGIKWYKEILPISIQNTIVNVIFLILYIVICRNILRRKNI